MGKGGTEYETVELEVFFTIEDYEKVKKAADLADLDLDDWLKNVIYDLVEKEDGVL